MKVILALAALIVAVHSLAEKDRINGKNGWYMPYLNMTEFSTFWVDLTQGEELLSNANSSEPNGPNEPVNFHLYTNLNPFIGQQVTPSSIQSSNFNRQHPTRFIIHGWTARYDDEMNKNLTSAWLSKGEYNIISIEWTRTRDPDFYVVAHALPDIGKRVGDFIKTLNQDNGMSLDTLHLIGHSFGAHIAGYAGKTVGSGRVGTIIGLDPAQPLFRFDRPDRRLSATDAKFVEVIHTSFDKLGFLMPIGKRDLYVNGGRVQPNCGVDTIGRCSHDLARNYYENAVRKGYLRAIKCPSYEYAIKQTCGNKVNRIVLGTNTGLDMVEGSFNVPLPL